MELRILSVHEHGNANEEYVLLSVLKDCDLSHYGLADTTYVSENKVSNRLRHFFWWPSKKVSVGDLVSLRTGKGKSATLKNANGQAVHRFYWGLDSAVWNDTGDAAVLIHISEWRVKKA